MPRASYIAMFLPVLLMLVAYFPVGCFGASFGDLCTFDKIMAVSDPPPTVVVVREVPRPGKGARESFAVGMESRNKDWTPIRIVLSLDDLNDNTKYCTQDGEKRPNFMGQNVLCYPQDIFTADKNKTLIQEILPLAVKLHAERLLVQPLNGHWKLPQFAQRSNCNYFNVPQSHYTAGIPDADMVLYVAAGADPSMWAVPCATEPSGRAVASAIHLPTFTLLFLWPTARMASHAIAHTLGFSALEMSNRNMLLTIPNLRGSTTPTTLVNSPGTLEKTRKHYNCNTLQGMELHKDDKGVVESHWSRRNAKDELMSLHNGYTAGYYTALTLSLFEDLGYYKIAWEKEELMSWGNDTGCDFLDNPCTKTSYTVYPEMFCQQNIQALFCTSDRQAVGECIRDIGDANAQPREYCPILFPTIGSGGNFDGYRTCTLSGSGAFPGSAPGDDSWCLDGNGLEAHSLESTAWQSDISAVCVEIICGINEVLVKYLGGVDFESCPEGTTISPQSQYFRKGEIKCPKYSEVCTIASNGSSVEIPPDPPDVDDGSDSGPPPPTNPDDDDYCEDYYAWPDDGSIFISGRPSMFFTFLIAAAVVLLL